MNRLILLESPFSSDSQKVFCDHYFYLCLVARKLMKEQNDAPLFFHALYTQMLNDNVVKERDLGLEKSFHWHTKGDCKLYAIDRGISKGMILGALDSIEKNIEIQFFTAMPETHWVSRRIQEINVILDNKSRWEEGVKLVKELEKIQLDNGDSSPDLTGYTEHNQNDIDLIKNCILEFFAPMIDFIRQDR